MNKKLFFLAIAALGLAACSNDDVVEINQSLEDANTISFRPVVTNVTRATDITASSLQTSGFTVHVALYGALYQRSFPADRVYAPACKRSENSQQFYS